MTAALVALDADELDELRTSVREALNHLAPLSATAALLETAQPWDRQAWDRLVTELALPGIAVAAEHGGQGFGTPASGVVLEELGRVLHGGPYLASAAIAAGAITLTGDPALGSAWLPRLASGASVATLAVDEGTGDLLSPRSTSWSPRGQEDTGHLYGTKVAVLAAEAADVLLTTATDAAGDVVFVAVTVDQPGVRVEAEPVLDLTRPLSRVVFTGARGSLVRTGPPVRAVLAAIGHLRGAALASEQSGAARAVLDLTIGYARTRIQFGREIGSFQAVRHRIADLHADVEIAAAAARAAAASVDWSTPAAAVAATTARSVCSETFLHVAEEAIQLHGGIGFTWEHPAHLFLKRAKSSELLFGDPAMHRARLHDLMFAPEGQAR